MASSPILALILAHVEAASRLTALLNGQLTPMAIAAGIAIAYVFGAMHALSPGHGKTLVGAYLMAIGISGGLAPCPSALVLLLSAIALHQIAYGLVLIGGFSLGLASVLKTLGLAAVYGRQWLERFPIGNGVMQRLSVVSALATVCVGLSLTTVALMG